MATTIHINVTVAAGAATAQMKQLNNLILQLGQSARKASAQGGGSFTQMATSISKADKALGQLGATFAAMGIARAVQSILDAFGKLRTAEISIEAVSSSLEVAHAAFAGIIDIAKKTGTEIKGLATEWIRLRSAGFSEYEATRLTDITATVAKIRGGGELLIYQLTKAFADIKSKGKVNAQEVFRQFGEAGIPAARMLADAMSKELNRAVSSVELTKLMEQGRINAEAALRVLQEGLEKMVDPAKLKQLQQTVFSERWKLFAVNVELAAAALGKELTPNAIKAVDDLQKLLNIVSNLAPKFKELPQPVKEAAIAIGILTAALVALGGAMTVLGAIGLGRFAPLIGQLGIIIAAATAAKELDKWLDKLQSEERKSRGVEAWGPEFRKSGEGFWAGLARLDQRLTPKGIEDWLRKKSGEVLNGPLAQSPKGQEFAQQLSQVRLMEDQIQKMTAQVQGLAVPLEAIRTLGDPAQLSAEQLKLYTTALQTQIDKLKELGPKLLTVDKEAMEAAEKSSAALLAAAKARAEELIGSPVAKLLFRYQTRFESAKPSEKATLETYEALAIEIEHEIRKEKFENAKRQREFDLDEVNRAKEIAAIRIQADSDETLAGRRHEIEQMYIEEKLAAQQIAALRKQYAEEDFHREAARLDLAIARQSAEVVAIKDPEKRAAAQRDLDLTIQYRTQAYLTLQADQLRIDKETARLQVRLSDETQAKIREIERQYAKERRDEQVQFDLERAQSLTDRTRAALEAVPVQGPEQARARINEIRDLQVKSIEKQRDLRIDAIRNEYAVLRVLAKTDASRRELDLQQQREEMKITASATEALEMARVDAHREANQMILDQTREMYGEIRDVVGQLFDAFTNKSESIWRSLASTMKSIFLGAIRDIVTSRVAGMLFGMFGGVGSVSYGGTPYQQIRGRFPIFGGLAAAPAVAASMMLPSGASAQSNFQPLLGGGSAGLPSWMPSGSMLQTLSSLGMASTGIQSVSGSAGMPSIDALWNLPQRRASRNLGLTGWKMPTQLQMAKAKFGIGLPVMRGGTQIPWAQATRAEKLRGILGSPGFQSAAAMVGAPVALAGLQRSGLAGDLMIIGGAAGVGFGLASTLGMTSYGGAIFGAGLGLAAAGIKRGGAMGLGMAVAGGAIAGMQVAGPIGALVGAGIGAVAGTIRLFVKSQGEKARAKIKQVYGIDVSDQSIIQQVVEIAKNQYGGNLDIAIRSQEVQEIVRLYSLTRGLNANLPRPMYGATFAQAGGGLQMQPVYNNGQLVQSPYVGTTTQQWSTAGLYMQLNPAQAVQLFSGQVVNVMQENPATIAQANAAATRSGDSRNAFRGALMEPATVMA